MPENKLRLTRRQLLIGGGAAIAVGTAGFLIPKFRFHQSRPNIVFILADDLRWDALGFSGNTRIKTPNLDALAAQSTVFKNAFVTTSICPTSRASILTGEYVMRHGIDSFNKTLPPEKMRSIFPMLLRDSGYYTGFIGKWGIGQMNLGNDKPGERGIAPGYFDVWKTETKQSKGQMSYRDPSYGGLHLLDYQGAWVERFISGRPQNKPFFLEISTKATHFPFNPQERFLEMYKDTHFPLPASWQPRPRNEKKKTLSRTEAEARLQKPMRHYAGLVSGLDELVGKTVALLEREKLMDNSYIVFTSDNGLMMGEHGFHGKSKMFEESIRVPCLIYAPGGAASVHDKIALNIDFAPTMLEMAGIAPSASMRGRSLLSPDTGRDAFLYYHPRMKFGASFSLGVREARWKYWQELDKDRKVTTEFLFDLENDSLELKNLARDRRHTGEIRRLKKRMETLLYRFS